MKLSVWAKKNGISYQTAWGWFKNGKMPARAIQTPTGTILVEEEIGKDEMQAWTYARVSSHAQREDLERQSQRCVDFCRTNGWKVVESVKEIASGMNDKRPRLVELLKSKPSRIVVEHKDRLTRFGFHYFDVLLPMMGCDLVVMNRDIEEKSDLVKDLIAIVTSFCCRLYGMRKGQVKAHAIRKEIECVEPVKSV